MGRDSKHNYDESKIKTLSSLEHIRLRTGMYIGRIGDGSHYDDGAYILLKEVIDNAIDEYIMGFGKEIIIEIDDKTVSVRDYGRGIPLGKVVDCVSTINTGAKYNDEVFQFSVGLNGVGTKAVNALSQSFRVRSHRDGQFAEASFSRGDLKERKKGKCKNEVNGTFVEFVPDAGIFKKLKLRPELIERRLKHYSYLNSGLKLVCNGETFYSRHGLLDLIKEDVDDEAIYPPLYYSSKTLEFCFTHSTGRSGETFFSFVNGQYTSDGGTHLSAFREGLLKAVNEYAKGKFDGDDVRECMVGAVAIRLQDPMFESQTKNKLGNTEIRSELVTRVREQVLHLLHKDKAVADKLVAKVEDTRKLRKELMAVKKMARERAKAVSLRIPQLKDCKKHLNKKKDKGEGTMVLSLRVFLLQVRL
jgi:topoisomerase-4 subunit B